MFDKMCTRDMCVHDSFIHKYDIYNSFECSFPSINIHTFLILGTNLTICKEFTRYQAFYFLNRHLVVHIFLYMSTFCLYTLFPSLSIYFLKI